jgi:hypothetical protein
VCGYCGTRLVEKAALPEPAPAKKTASKPPPTKKTKAKTKPKPAPAKKAPVKAEKPQPAPVKKVQAKTEKPKPIPAKVAPPPAERKKLPKWAKIVGLAAAAVVVLALVLFFGFVSPLPEDKDGSTEAQGPVDQADAPSKEVTIQTGGSIGADDLDALAGTWSGTAGSSDGEFDITFRLKEGCSLYMVCGTFNIPEWGCSGDISFVGVDGDKFEFRASTKIGCGDDESAYEEWLRPVGSSKLEYYSRGDYGVSQGTLTRQ